MTVFQRRQASSTYALMRSFERRLVRLDEAIELVRDAAHMDELETWSDMRLGDDARLLRGRTRRTRTFRRVECATEGHEEFEEQALAGIVAAKFGSASGMSERRWKHCSFNGPSTGRQSRKIPSSRELSGVLLSHPDFATEKFIIFSEHRDTAEFLVHRLEGLGFTGQVALIHGGLGYLEREAQVDLFRQTDQQGGCRLPSRDRRRW